MGVVGCGASSDSHLNVYSRLPNITLAAVHDTDHKRALEKASRYRIKQVPDDYESMLNMDLDIVDIVTPTHTHARLAILALELGHDVLVEKPMAVSSKECEMMIDAARKMGRGLCVTHNKRFYDSIVRAKRVVENEGLIASRIGIMHLYPTLQPELRPPWILTEQSGGILWESMVHDAYLAEYFLGETRSAQAFVNRLNQPVFDSITLILRNDEKIAVCQTEWNVAEGLEVLELLTREGDRFTVNLPHDLLLRKSRKYKDRRTTILRTLYDDFHDPCIKWYGHAKRLVTGVSYDMAFPFERTFLALIEEFISYLNGAATVPPVTGDEGLRSIRVLEAAQRSIASGRTEAVG